MSFVRLRLVLRIAKYSTLSVCLEYTLYALPKIYRTGTLWLIQEPGEQPPVVLVPAVSINTVSQWGACVSKGTSKCVVAVLGSGVLAATPVVLYPVQFAVELRIE